MNTLSSSLPILIPQPHNATPELENGFLLNEICNRLLPEAAAHTVADVRIGLGYTAVLLSNGRCGLAYTFRHETGYGCGAFRDADNLNGRSAAELLGLASQPDVIASAVALATANALVEPPADEGIDGFDLMGLQPADVAGMVGYFGPLIENLKKRVKVLHIFERVPKLGVGVLPESDEAELLPKCQVVIVTATALLNRTLDRVLSHCENAREVMLLGATTPYAPEALAAKGVTILSGTRVHDAERALRIVSQGGGTMKLNAAMRRYSLRIAPSR